MINLMILITQLLELILDLNVLI